MTKPELKFCPFCDSDDVKIYSIPQNPEIVICNECGSGSNSVERWNTRFAPKLRPLIWHIIGDGSGRDIYSTIYWADSPLGRYYIGSQPPRYEGARFDWSGPGTSGERGFVCLTSAKAAAEAAIEAECKRIFMMMIERQ